ncbi:unnamed protein product [Closterium sp. NIES-64]|nr:unnamed protein product [Closterium sp. NIES-64]
MHEAGASWVKKGREVRPEGAGERKLIWREEGCGDEGDRMRKDAIRRELEAVKLRGGWRRVGGRWHVGEGGRGEGGEVERKNGGCGVGGEGSVAYNGFGGRLGEEGGEDKEVWSDASGDGAEAIDKLGAIDKLELLHDTTAVNWASFEDSLHTHLGSLIIQDYCLLDIDLEHPNGLPPVPPPLLEPPPPDAPPPLEPHSDPPRAPIHDDNPDRWAANLNNYNKLRDAYTIQREAHCAAEKAHADATAHILSYTQDERDYAEELRKFNKDTAAWRVADHRALAIIFSCIPSHLKHDLRPTSSSGL